MSSDDDDQLEDRSMHDTSAEETPPLQPTRLLLTRLVGPVSLLKGIFCLLGVGMLVPWNAFISAKDYFQARFCMAHMESTFVVVYTLSSAVAMGVILAGQWWWEQRRRHRIPTEEPPESISGETKSSEFWFVQIPLTTCACVFVAQAMMVTSVFLKGVSAWTLFSLTVSGVASVVLSAGIVAVAGRFTQADWAMNPYLQGQSLGGVAVSLANYAAAISKNPADFWEDNCPNSGNGNMTSSHNLRVLNEARTCGNYHSIDWGMFVYFSLGALVLVMCLVGHSWIEALRLQIDNSSTTNDLERESQRMGVELLRNIEDDHEETLHHRSRRQEISGNEEMHETSLLANYGAADGLLRGDVDDNDELEAASVTHVLWLVRGPTTCIFTTFVVTLALFPGWTSELTSVWRCKTHFRLANDLYSPFTFVIFNAGDLFGRLIASRCMRFLRNRLVVASFLRTAFVPLLLSCNSIYSNRFHIPSDLYSFLVQMAFSISNGMLLTVSFAQAPTLLSPHRKDEMNQHMSEILSFAVALGLLGGSLLSFPVSSLLMSA